jgi:hypothetical protein
MAYFAVPVVLILVGELRMCGLLSSRGKKGAQPYHLQELLGQVAYLAVSTSGG